MLRSSYIPLRAQASPSMVCMLPPFIVCKQEEEEAFYCFRELQRRMTRDLGDLPCSCVCVCVCASLSVMRRRSHVDLLVYMRVSL